MSHQTTLCLCIFAATLLCYAINRIPLWLSSLLSLCALVATGCLDAPAALAGFSNPNTVLMAAMFVVAAGFRRTSLTTSMVAGILRFTRGSFRTAYFAFLLLSLLLTNFIATPMVVYSIVSPLLCTFLDQTGRSRSRYVFPLMVVCVSCYGILPLSIAIQMAGQFTGFLASYGFSDLSVRPVDFLIAAWPILFLVTLWALYLAPKFCPETGSAAIREREACAEPLRSALSPALDRIGIALFFATILCLVFSSALGLPAWLIALIGSLLMCLFGVVDGESALREIRWDTVLLYVGALALGSALTATGAGEYISKTLSAAVGSTRRSYLLGAVFFLLPFLFTQFMLNRTTLMIFVPICLLACSALGANPIGPLLLVNAGCATSFMTPMATPAVAVCMADGGYTLRDLLRSSWLITLLLSAVYIFYVMTVFPCF